MSSHTSGCGCQRHGTMACRITSLPQEDVEHHEHREIHQHREYHPGEEHPAEQLVVEPQVHEEHDHEAELDDHEEGQGTGENLELEFLDVVQTHFDRSQSRQYQGDDDVGPVGRVLVPFLVVIDDFWFGFRCHEITVMRSRSWDQVDDGEDHDPHHVDEVPIEADDLDALRLVLR